MIEGSTIRVGISAIGYAFPAPTGIVDYNLRHPGDGTPSATIIANAGPYDARGVSIDGSVPLAGKELLLPMGVSTQVSTQTPYGTYPGYTSTVTSAGATPQWSPNDKVTVRALFDWQHTRNATSFPLYFTAGDFLPRPLYRGYLGQNWVRGRSLTENLGGLVIAQTESPVVARRRSISFDVGQPRELRGPLHQLPTDRWVRTPGRGVSGSKRRVDFRGGAPERSLPRR